MQDAAIKLQPFKVGRYYDVLFVRGYAAWHVDDWPVLGPFHSDAEYIGFEDDHYHIDLRFCTKKQFMDLCGLKPGTEFSHVICEQELDWSREIIKPEPLGMRRTRCKRQYPEYPFKRAKWLTELEDAYRESRVTSNVCPHRGANLRGLTADSDGCVTCPLHGLRWECSTGRLAGRPAKENS